jgi:hypothetical protein
MVIENPVGGCPKDPYDEYRKQKEKETREEAPSKPAFYPLMQILLWMRDIIDSFLRAPAPKTVNSFGILKELKNIIESLKDKDRSQDVDFSNTLSSCWNKTLILSRKHLSAPLRAFIKEIQHYPKDQDHTLGYYLTEYAGQNWLPFPYIELLKKIHEEHLTSPATSALSRWTRELDHLIATLAD